MAVIPTQRETVSRAPTHEPGMPTRRGGTGVRSRTPLSAAAPSRPAPPGASYGPPSPNGPTRPARSRVLPQRLTDDAMVVVSELVTNAVVHAGTDVELACRLETRENRTRG